MKIFFLGTNDFAAEILESLNKIIKIQYVMTKDDSKVGRGQKLTPSPVKQICIKYGIKTHIIETSINSSKEKNFIEKTLPDIIILIGYGEKIDAKIINIPKYGIINVHPSILPNLRGATPIEHAIINNLNETGVSIIKIDNNIDTGPILNIKKCKITKNDTYDSLFIKLKKISLTALIDTLKNIDRKTIIAQKQIAHTNRLLAPKIEKNFYKINWNKPALEINRNIRSTFSKKKHYAEINKHIVKIIETTVINRIKASHKNLLSGTILKISTNGIDVKTPEKIIRIKKLQFPGKKITNIPNILNSINNKIKSGYTFS